MDTNTKTAKTTAAAPKRTRKIKTAPMAVKAAAAPKVKINAHVEAGVNFGTYEGESKGNNANRPVKIMAKDKVETLTSRCQKNLYALRSTYGNKQFEAKGIDNGVLRDLVAAGILSTTGGRTENIDGKTYLMDGASPVMLKFTAQGMSYGKA